MDSSISEAENDLYETYLYQADWGNVIDSYQKSIDKILYASNDKIYIDYLIKRPHNEYSADWDLSYAAVFDINSEDMTLIYCGIEAGKRMQKSDLGIKSYTKDFPY